MVQFLAGHCAPTKPRAGRWFWQTNSFSGYYRFYRYKNIGRNIPSRVLRKATEREATGINEE
jgi:hypothetical protein